MEKENIDDLGMDSIETLQDTINTLNLQGVDLFGIVTCVPGESLVGDNPVIQSLDRLKQLGCDWLDRIRDEKELEEIIGLLDKLNDVCSGEGSGNAAIATKNGGVQLVCLICSKLGGVYDRGLISALNILASFLHDLPSTERFCECGGTKMVVGILIDGSQNINILNSYFSVIAITIRAAKMLPLKHSRIWVLMTTTHSQHSKLQ